jgi:hypothetical protein
MGNGERGSSKSNQYLLPSRKKKDNRNKRGSSKSNQYLLPSRKKKGQQTECHQLASRTSKKKQEACQKGPFPGIFYSQKSIFSPKPQCPSCQGHIAMQV